MKTFIQILSVLILLWSGTVLAQVPWPLSPTNTAHKVWNGYGEYAGDTGGAGWHFHEGADIPAPGGTEVLSSTNGKVVERLNAGDAYGRLMTVSVAVNDTTTGWGYVHIQPYNHPVHARTWQVGDTVNVGDTVGHVTTHPAIMGHLHFEYNNDDRTYHPAAANAPDLEGNPLEFLNPAPAATAPTLFSNFHYRKQSGEGAAAAPYFGEKTASDDTVVQGNIDINARAYDRYGTFAGTNYDVVVKKIEFKVDEVKGGGDIAYQTAEEFSGKFLGNARAPLGRNEFARFRDANLAQHTIYEDDNTSDSKFTDLSGAANDPVFWFNLTNKDDDDDLELSDSTRYWDTDAKTGQLWNNNSEAAANEATKNSEAAFPDGRYVVTVKVTGQEGNQTVEKVDTIFINNFDETIESCDMAGAVKNVFDHGDSVYVKGEGFPKNRTFKVYLVKNTNFTDRDKITDKDIVKSVDVTTNNNGEIPATLVWNHYCPNGKPDEGYDLILDYDEDNKFSDKKITKVVDPVDDKDVGEAGIKSTDPNQEAFKLSFAVTDISCEGQDDGAINLTVTDGQAPFTFKWSNGATTEDISNLEAGNYEVEVTDKDMCTAKKDTLLEEPELDVSVSGGGLQIFCDTDGPPSVTLQAVASGGEQPYTYSWPGGRRTVSSTGLYTVTVTDKNGCTESASTYIVFIPVVCSRDPNDIIGPDGYGADKWVSVHDRLPYMVRFENDPDFATAPAQEVFIDHVMDSTVDLYSFRLSDFGFGSFVFQVPPNRTFYSQRLDVRDSLGIFVDVTAGLNINEHKAFWIFRSIDPATGLPPNDANAGFLPVNDTLLNNGEGFVTFSVVPISTALTGDTIHAEAEIVFDINAPLKTPAIYNLIDAFPPVSTLDSILNPVDTSLVLSCTAADDSGGVGVASYSLYVSENGGAYQLLISGLEIDSSYTFRGVPGRSYCFYTRAKDHVGNEEPIKTTDEGCFTQREVGYVAVLTPNGGEQYCIGDTAAIRWTSSGLSQVDVLYSADGGTTYTALATSRSANDSVLNWILADTLAGSTNYLVMVRSSLDSANADTSDALFTIRARPSQPNPVASGPTTFCAGDDVTLTGPGAMAVYDWSNGATTQAIVVSIAGTYTLTVTDGFGCESFTSNPVMVIVNPLPTAAITAAGPTTFCADDDVTLNAPAGFASYLWSNGATTSSTTVNTSGSYTATVTDGNGCTSLPSNALSVTVNPLPSQPLVTAGGPTTFCAGDSVQLSAPAGFVGYLWSSGSTTADITVNSSGSYSVAVTDGNGCTSPTSLSTSVTVNPLPNQPLITASGPTVFCQGGSVQLSVPAGFTSYDWSNGATTSSITVAVAASFTVSVTDANGCESPLSAAVSTTVNPLPSQPAVTASGTTTFCAGGSVQLSASAGFASYLWSTGATTSSLTVSAAGSYTARVTDANGCQSVASVPVSVTVNALPPQPTLTANGPTIFCAGGAVQLSAPAGYTSYLWSTGATTQNITVAASGSFTARVTDANGCQSPVSLPAAVTVNPLPPQPAITSNPGLVFCQGSSTVLSAPAGYSSYLWSNGFTTASLTVDTVGSYTVRVTDANGCQSIASAAVSTTVNPLPSQPVVTANGPTTFCAGGSVQLSVPVGFSSYLWSTGATSSSLTVTTAGSYTARVTDANGCQSPQSVPMSVTVNALPPQPTVTASGPTTFCAGDSVQLIAPGGFSSYLWSTGATTQSLTVSTSGSFTARVTDVNGCQSPVSLPTAVTVNPLPPQPAITSNPGLVFCQGDNTVLRAPAGFSSYLWSNGFITPSLTVDTVGTYTVQVTDANGCQSLASVSVTTTVNPLPSQPVLTANGPTTFCQGDSVQLSAPAGFNAYSWSTGATTTSIWVLATGSYTATVTDANGCESPASLASTVTVNALPPQPAITSSGLVFCQGDSATLSAPAGYSSYLWSNGLTTPNLTVDTAGTFTVQVTDANGCQSPASAAVSTTVNPLPAQPVITSTGLVLCQGDSTVLSAPAGFSSYLWSNGLTTPDLTVDTAGTFTVTVTDANGCESPVSAAVSTTVNPLPQQPVLTAGGPTTFCAGDSVELSAPAGFSAYSWSTGDATASIWVLASGSYTATVIDANGCESPASLPTTVTVNALPAQPSIVAIPGLSFCQGDSAILMAPAGFVSYDWSTGDTAQDITVGTAGSFTVTVTDANGCESPVSPSATTTVNALPPKPLITSNDSLAFCEGSSITLNAAAGFSSYLWSTGATGSSITVSTAGSFSLTVTDNNGCESPASDTVTTTTIPLPATPVVTLTGSDSLFCTVSGTAYQWFLNGAPLPDTTQAIKAGQSGSYQVIVFNGPCASDSSLGISVSVSITQILNGSVIDIFPNPTRGLIFIQGELQTASLVEIHVFNALGQLVYEAEGYARNGKLKERVRLDNVADGVYVLRLRVGTDYLFKKVQVQQ